MSNVTRSERDVVDLGNYERLTEFKLAYAPVTVAKYRSKKTGFSVVVANNKAPITNAYFTVATEIFDDTGRPHTLEHLVFLGSKNYPYKGVLDNLANRAGGDGTNAWTADDREFEAVEDAHALRDLTIHLILPDTAYTISTAGSEGFLNMLPSELCNR
jgi:Zn-dependent M16 (insulinase) family peptidase